MEYFIFNNIDSREFRNIIVSELPPITKPKMRTKQTHINGLDGVLVEELGYESYTKTVRFGIKNSKDIDKIIIWLEGVGDLTFSNEPDKIYRGMVYDQIDFEALLRFRTVEVTFLVQPFKFSTLERKTGYEVSGLHQLKLANVGNVFSKPILNLYGSGVVSVSLKNEFVFRIDFGDDQSITVDSDKMDAYSGEILKNRQMYGDFLHLPVGVNELTWDGTLTRIEARNISRWL